METIAQKINAQVRISEEEALQLFECGDLQALGYLANLVNERKNGKRATYIFNRYINYSNICILSCQFCSFTEEKKPARRF